MLSSVAHHPNFVFERYEEHKIRYKDTGQLCEDQGFTFTPMVMEAHSGAWAPAARKVLDRVARGQATSNGSSSGAASLLIAQRLSIALHRENARAIIKRMGRPVAEPISGSGWAHYDDSLDG